MKFSKKDLNIIRNSKELEKHPILVEYFRVNDNHKSINTKDIEIKGVSEFIDKYGGKLLNNARSEYEFNQEVKYESEDYTCELCGQKHLSKLFKIVNKENKSIFWVGSTCVEEFGFNSSKEKISIALEQVFNQEFPDYNKLVENKKYRILIPEKIVIKRNEIVKTFEKMKKNFVKDNFYKLETIKKCYESLKKVNEDILEYVRNNKEKEWVVSNEIIDWFEELNYNDKETYRDIVNELKKTGFYSESNFYLIREKIILIF
ncbi:hypothetical protein B5C00_06720 [Staphylococcus delphini]|uniref:hypothetical protein n=1 Tax=Staphylococcus delphini TaxID=53344 RepID=UPI000BBB963C|nr:hypothetical protein [Staphylococcus delphini]PCF34117.1 hypothetical protein B5C00_06720 [Staphylococcus delphini]